MKRIVGEVKGTGLEEARYDPATGRGTTYTVNESLRSYIRAEEWVEYLPHPRDPEGKTLKRYRIKMTCRWVLGLEKVRLFVYTHSSGSSRPDY